MEKILPECRKRRTAALCLAFFVLLFPPAHLSFASVSSLSLSFDSAEVTIGGAEVKNSIVGPPDAENGDSFKTVVFSGRWKAEGMGAPKMTVIVNGVPCDAKVTEHLRLMPDSSLPVPGEELYRSGIWNTGPVRVRDGWVIVSAIAEWRDGPDDSFSIRRTASAVIKVAPEDGTGQGNGKKE